MANKKAPKAPLLAIGDVVLYERNKCVVVEVNADDITIALKEIRRGKPKKTYEWKCVRLSSSTIFLKPIPDFPARGMRRIDGWSIKEKNEFAQMQYYGGEIWAAKDDRLLVRFVSTCRASARFRAERCEHSFELFGVQVSEWESRKPEWDDYGLGNLPILLYDAWDDWREEVDD